MNELLSALDESVFTPELSQKVLELFESKIAEVKADAAEKLLESETTVKELSEKLETLEEESKAELEKLKEYYIAKGTEYQEHITEFYEGKTEGYIVEVKKELEEKLDAFLKLVVEDFVEENKMAIDESVKAAKVDAILEGFDSLLITTGVELGALAEAKTEGSKSSEIETLKKGLSKALAENTVLKAEQESMIKESVLSKFTASMSIVQKDKFMTLAEMVVYSDAESYEAKVKTIAETFSKKESKETSTVVTESVNAPAHKRYF